MIDSPLALRGIEMRKRERERERERERFETPKGLINLWKARGEENGHSR